MAHAVRAFFDNGGKRLYIARTFIPRTAGDGTVTSDGIAAIQFYSNGGNTAGFSARAQVNRIDHGMTYAQGGIGDVLDLIIEVEGHKK